MPTIDLAAAAYRVPGPVGTGTDVGSVEAVVSQSAPARAIADGIAELGEFSGRLLVEHGLDQRRSENAADIGNALIELRSELMQGRIEAGSRQLNAKDTRDALARRYRAFTARWDAGDPYRIRHREARQEVSLRAKAAFEEASVQAMAEALSRERQATEERWERTEAHAVAFRDEALLDKVRESKVAAGEDAEAARLEHEDLLLMLQAGRFSDKVDEIAISMADPEFDHEAALGALEADLDAGSGFGAIPEAARAGLKGEARSRVGSMARSARAERGRQAAERAAQVDAGLLDVVRRVGAGEIGESEGLRIVYRNALTPGQAREFRELVQGANAEPEGITPEAAFEVRDILQSGDGPRAKDAKLRQMQKDGKLSVGDYLKFSEKAASGEGQGGAVGSVKKQMAGELKALYGEGRLVLGQYGGAPQDFQRNMVPPGLTTEDFAPVTDGKELDKVQAGKPRSPRADFDPFVDDEEVPRFWQFVSATAFDLEFLEGEVDDYASKHPNAGRDEIWTYLNENYLYPTRLELARLRLVSERRTERLKPDFGERGTMLRNLQGPPSEPAKRPRDRSRPDPYASRNASFNAAD